MTLGFTNGCFDAELHEGHRHLLREAAKLCDRLIVGVNTDASVRAIKGYGRPLNSLAARMMAIRALGYEAMAFDEDDPRALLSILKPDIIFKGSDYEGKEVVGSDLARVVLIPRLPGWSTTELLAKRTA